MVGLIILTFDGLLWYDTPKNGHAYALIAFTVIQLTLLSGRFLRSRWSVRATLYWSTTYLLLLLNPLNRPHHRHLARRVRAIPFRPQSHR